MEPLQPTRRNVARCRLALNAMTAEQKFDLALRVIEQKDAIIVEQDQHIEHLISLARHFNQRLTPTQ